MLNKRWFRIVIYAVIAALFLGGIYITIRDNVLIPAPYTPPPTPTPPLTPTPPPEATPTPPATESPAVSATPAPPTPTPKVELTAPVKIYFNDADPKVSAEIQPVGVTAEGAMDAVAAADIAGWFKDGPSPGEAGNALIDGHVRWKGKMGTFSILKNMKPGDEVVIEYADGSFKYFEAMSVDVYSLADFPPEVMALDIGGEPRMTLITCLGDYDRSIGTSRSRVVAVCKEQGV